MAQQRITATLTALIGTAALLGTPMLFATEHNDAKTPAEQTQASEQAPDLKTLIDKVESSYGGKVVGIEREHHGKGGIYEVELLGSDGHEQEFYINSAGEKVTGKHHHSEHESGKHEGSKHESGNHEDGEH